jgi:cellulose synthase/poly-beta-1,6-N-acetylglucosamine synthase-like glycosyltransferase
MGVVNRFNAVYNAEVNGAVALAVISVVVFSAKVTFLLKFPLSSAVVVPNELKTLNNSTVEFACALPVIVTMVLLVMLSLLLMPMSSVVANAKLSGVVSSNFWVNFVAAILAFSKIIPVAALAAILTAMLPVSAIFGVTIKVKTLL